MIRARAALSPGSSDDVAVLLERVRTRLYGILRAFAVPLEDREDLLQDVLLAFVVKRAEIVSADLWLPQALRLRCRQYRRDLALHREIALDETADTLTNNEAPPRWAGAHVDVERELTRLPARLRSVLLLQFWLGLDAREVAQRTGFAPGSVRKTVSRGLSRLRRRLRGRD